MQGDKNASEAKPSKEKPQRTGAKATGPEHSSRVATTSPDPAIAGTGTVVVRDYSRRAAQPRKPAAKAADKRLRKNWRESEITVFCLGWIIIAGVEALVAHYSTYKPWMLLFSLFIGTVYALVFTLGGRER